MQQFLSLQGIILFSGIEAIGFGIVDNHFKNKKDHQPNANTEMLARVTDEAIQIFGGMGLMDELPLERFWRDARVERIWDGTSEIQRHIISRDLLRPLGG